MSAIKLKPISIALVEITIEGTSPYISHCWSEKAKQAMRDKHGGKKTKTREIRDPEAEAMAAAYYTEDGQFGIPAMAVKTAIIDAAHKDLGIEKTLVCKALHLICADTNLVLPITYRQMILREDHVRIGRGQTDLRYRPEFRGWQATVQFEVDTELLTDGDLVNLITRAGFGIGIGEMRPQKKGEFGRFRVAQAKEAALKEAA